MQRSAAVAAGGEAPTVRSGVHARTQTPYDSGRSAEPSFFCISATPFFIATISATIDAAISAGADDEQAPARAEQRAQMRAVELEALAARGGLDAHQAGAQVEFAGHQFMARSAREHLVDPGGVDQRLVHQAQVLPQGRPKRTASSLLTP